MTGTRQNEEQSIPPDLEGSTFEPPSGQPVPPKGRIPLAVPWFVRRRLYLWHPRRARRWRAMPGLERVNGCRAVLTFDDGPGTNATPRVLGELDRLGVQATFFVLGAEVCRAPELARRIVAEGHEIGLHGFAHPSYDELGVAHARRDLEKGLEAIETVTGIRPCWFRPPYGKLSASSYQLCLSMNLNVVYWSAWGLDWEEIGPDAISAEVVSSLTPGAIVLLHDTARYGRRARADPTAEALRAIVDDGRRLGLTWTTLSEATDAPS
jgi:peptidoglycan-N-acetylglucosamine deacetylase